MQHETCIGVWSMTAVARHPLKMNSDVQRIFRKLLSLISSKIRFEESKKIFLKFYPVCDLSEIKRRHDYLKRLFEFSNAVNGVRKIEKPEFKLKRVSDRVLLVEGEDYERAIQLGVCDVNLEGEYDIILGSKIEINEISAEEIVPEIYINELYEKRESLEEVSRIMKCLGKESVIPKILDEISKVEESMERLKAVRYFEEFVYRKLEEIRERIERKVEKERIVFEGKEILEILESSGKKHRFHSKISEIEEMIIEEIDEAEREISREFGISAEIFLRQAIPQINFRELERVRKEVERNAKLEFYLKSREILRRIRILLPKLEEEFYLIFEIEVAKGLKEVIGEYNFPEFKEGIITFTKGRNLFLKDPQPVSYIIGNGSLEGFRSKERVVVLTGANSGGKTSLLHLIVQIQLLAQMGLPVPAEAATLDIVDEIHFFKRKRSIHGAGTFESILKNFTSALTGEGRKLILVDEFEAITEPGAAIKMLSAFLKIANERGYYVAVVSHMAENLKLDFVRVDGIEASGLDERLELIVDRQPKFGVIGRSTPELIVERVYKLSKGDKKDILEIVLSVFKAQDAEISRQDKES